MIRVQRGRDQWSCTYRIVTMRRMLMKHFSHLLTCLGMSVEHVYLFVRINDHLGWVISSWYGCCTWISGDGALDRTDVETTEDDQSHSSKLLVWVSLVLLKQQISYFLFSSPSSLPYSTNLNLIKGSIMWAPGFLFLQALSILHYAFHCVVYGSTLVSHYW